MAESTSFSCGDALDISHAAALHSRLERALQKANIIELKADSVEKIDTAGLQLILSIKKELENSGGSIVWKKPSEKLLSAAKLLGLYQQLGFD